MSEYRRQLFKQSKLNISRKRDEEQKENRLQRRSKLFDSQRNMDIENDLPFMTSTPFLKKKSNPILCAADNVASIIEEETEKVSTNHLTTADEKQTKKEAYLKRFVEWKKEKRQKQLEENAKKPPFMTCVNPRKKLKEPNAVQLNQFTVPSNHKFTAPTGIGDTVSEAKKCDSVYIAVPTPPRKKQDAAKSKFPNSLATAAAIVSKTASTSAGIRNATVHKGAIPKRPINTISSAASVASTSATTTKPSNSRQPLSQNLVKNSHKGPAPIAETLPKSVAKSLPNAATNKTGVSKTPLQVNSLVKPAAATASISKAKPIAATTNKNDAINKLAVVKKPVSKTAPSAVSKAKALNQKNMPPVKLPERAKLSVNLKAKSKLSSFPTRKNNLVTKNSNLVTRKAAAAIVTPLELCKTSVIFNFLTSTKVKSPKCARTLEEGKQLVAVESAISPIELLPVEAVAPNPKSAKHAFLQPPNTNGAENQLRRFNFLRHVELETTVDETPRDVTVKPKEKSIVRSPKLSTPRPKKVTPRRSLFLKDNQQRKFNFLRKISLNETTEIVESTVTIELPNEVASKENQTNETPKNTKNNKPGEMESSARNCEVNHSTIVNVETTSEDFTLVAMEANDEEEMPRRASSYLSPFVTCSRGKVSAKREREKRDSIYLPGTPSKDSNTNEAKVETPIEIRRFRVAVLHFRKQLQDEIARLHALCEQWQAYKVGELEKLENCGGSDMIDGTIGQTKLLTSKKFMQFKELIDRCELHANGEAAADDGSENTKIITPDDLEGFWSMLGLQVENIEKRFKNLDRWKANDWQDPDAPVEQPNPKKPTRTKKTIATKGKPRANSALTQKMREMRAAMRTAAKQTTNDETSNQADEHLVKYCSPRRLRRSTLNNMESQTRRENLSTSKNNTKPTQRVCVIVPDRRSRSITPTVISIPSPLGRHSPSMSPANRSVSKADISKDLLKQAVRTRRSLRKSVEVKIAITSPQPKEADNTEVVKSSAAERLRTPSPVYFNQDFRPILKTPGTARRQSRNVSFNPLLSVQKFRKYGKDQEATEYDQVKEVHMDELKAKFDSELQPASPDDDENVRTYRLRNRKVQLRPSSEFEIPK